MSIDIDAILERANAATPGPWKYVDSEDGLFGVEMDAGHNVLWDMEGTCDRCFGNMRFIAAARQDVPALCAEVRELRAALGRAANDLMLSEESFVTMRAKRDEVLSELRTTRAALERARAALERERMELVSASVSVSRARELTLAQEIRANNLSAALERARALLTDSHAYLTGKQSVSNPVRLVADITNFLQAAALGSGGAA